MITPKNHDTIVIGAGLAGLTAAAQLATSGQRVLVLERNRDFGGRARTDGLDGWLFNQGGHALYRNGVGHRTLQALGIEPDGEAPPLKGAQLDTGGAATPLPIGATSLLRTRALSGVGKLQFGRLLAAIPRLDPTEYCNVTIDDWLSPLRTDVQAVVKALVRLSTYAADTDVMSADAAISQLAGAQDGVLYLHGGWIKLCEQIATAATKADAAIVRGSKVESVSARADGYTVNADGVEYSAPSVIVAAGGPSLTRSLLGLDANHFGAVTPAPQAAVLDLALDGMPTKHRFMLGLNDPTYFSVHSPPARMAPKGKVAAVAMRYLHRHDDGSADEHRSSLERISQLAGATEPVRSRFLRRMTVTNGLPTAATGGLAGRPSIEVRDRPGLLLAGDWVGSRGLLADAAIASGYDAAVAAQRLAQSARAGTLA